MSACASGTHTIGDAFFFLQNGLVSRHGCSAASFNNNRVLKGFWLCVRVDLQADVIVAGGSEAAITPLCFAGFCAIKALTSSNNDNPTG